MFIDFIKSYWREILEVLAVVVSIIICCIKKKPVKVVDTVKESIAELLPYFINCAEENIGSGNGDKKLDYVVSLVKAAVEHNGFVFTDNYEKYVRFLAEQILSTPQKK